MNKLTVVSGCIDKVYVPQITHVDLVQSVMICLFVGLIPVVYMALFQEK